MECAVVTELDTADACLGTWYDDQEEGVVQGPVHPNRMYFAAGASVVLLLFTKF